MNTGIPPEELVELLVPLLELDVLDELLVVLELVVLEVELVVLEVELVVLEVELVLEVEPVLLDVDPVLESAPEDVELVVLELELEASPSGSFSSSATHPLRKNTAVLRASAPLENNLCNNIALRPRLKAFLCLRR